MDLAERFIPPFRRTFKAREAPGYDGGRYRRILAGLQEVINLNSGDPDLTAAPVAVEAAVEALRAGRTHYVFTGLPQLRDALARKLERDNGIALDAQKRLLITNGSAEAMSVLFQTLLEPGDEVLTTDPYYTGHLGAIRNAQGVPVFVPTTGDRLWEPDPADVDARITPRTKAFVFANPGNPTAAVYRRETLEALLDIARRRNILMVPDELFERYVYDGHRHVSMASLAGGDDRVVTMGGFSKSYCMTGWRLGWLAAPAWLAGPLEEVRYATSMATGTPNQWGAIAALSEAAHPYYGEVYRTYGERRRFFLDAVAAAGLPCRPAPGAFNGMLDIRPTGRSAAAVAEQFLIDAHVAMTPGPAFGPHGEGWVRYSLIQPLDRLEVAADRLGPVIRSLLRASSAESPSRT